jgi:hypothetical protein
MNKIIRVKMYFDEYEKYFGDGFYPLLEKEKDNSQITISFEYINDCWMQKSQDEITGLDGDIGKNLLEILNREANESGTVIKNSVGLIIYKE